MDPADLDSPERTEQIRRSLAMLPTGASAGWSREEAMHVLGALIHLQRRALGKCCESDRAGPGPGQVRFTGW